MSFPSYYNDHNLVVSALHANGLNFTHKITIEIPAKLIVVHKDKIISDGRPWELLNGIFYYLLFIILFYYHLLSESITALE